MAKRAIVISGGAGSGKDTVGSLLAEIISEQDGLFVITHFADLLKFTCEKFLGWDGVKDTSGRQMLQRVGTDIVRNQWGMKTYWVDYVADMIEMLRPEVTAIIPDCRFPDEIERLCDRGFAITHIHVERPDMGCVLNSELSGHESEQSMDNVRPDYTVINDCDLEGLKEKIRTMVREGGFV